MEKIAILVKKLNKNTGNKEWALVSKKDPSKILKWFGSKKPSEEEEVLKEERRIEYFKSLKSNVLKKLSKKTLYHSTHKKNLKSILKNGLIPQVGELTTWGHSSRASELVYFSDTPLKLYGENTITFELINPNNYYIYQYDGNGLQPFGEGSYKEHEDIPVGVEEGDYFTEDTIHPKDLKII